ncbi:hypothetical protein BU17DRAFT_72361 [Hysterangium stoloniferum]|nr:hypothetical protein BU17DRAFT_72361 [Hysterangium stoloniferum]
MPKQSVPSTFGGKRVAAKETVHDEGDATQCEDDDDERRFRRFRGVRVWRGLPGVRVSCPSCSATPTIAKNDEFVAIYMLSGIWEKPSIVCTMVEMSANRIWPPPAGWITVHGIIRPAHLGKDPMLGCSIPTSFPRRIPPSTPKSQTPGHDIVDVDDGNDKGANEDQDYTPMYLVGRKGEGAQTWRVWPPYAGWIAIDRIIHQVIFRIYFRDYGRVIERCRGFATCLERPQGLLDSSGIGQGMSNIEREAMTRWFAPVIRNPTDVEVGPGYFCGLKMERIGTKLLYGTKLSILVVKCFFNTRHVEEHQWRVVRLTDTEGRLARVKSEYWGKWLLINMYTAFISRLGTSEEGNIGRVIVVMAHVIDLMVFIEDSPAKMVPRNFPVTAMLSPRYVYHTLVDTSKHP